MDNINVEASPGGPIGSTKLPSRSRGSVFDALPQDMKNYMNKMIAQGLGERRLKTAMIQQFPDKLNLLEKSDGAYRRYILARRTVAGPNDGVLPAALDEQEIGTLLDRRKSIVNLLSLCEQRIKSLSEKAEKSSDPRYEAVLNGLIREKRQLLELLADNKEDFGGDDEDQARVNYVHEFIRVVFTNVIQVYRIVNGDYNYPEFETKLMAYLNNVEDFWKTPTAEDQFRQKK
jgi:hypothetical protein